MKILPYMWRAKNITYFSFWISNIFLIIQTSYNKSHPESSGPFSFWLGMIETHHMELNRRGFHKTEIYFFQVSVWAECICYTEAVIGNAGGFGLIAIILVAQVGSPPYLHSYHHSGKRQREGMFWRMPWPYIQWPEFFYDHTQQQERLRVYIQLNH